MTNSAAPQHRQARLGGLDGLRAIAVIMVLVYHLFPKLLPGGFLGVDVFFAISGFLITTLLLSELAANGRIRLVSFWRRRARRLLPALGAVLLVCTAVALILGGDLLLGIGKQFAGAALFVSNWVFIASGTDYFARDTAELFRNTWSLSIEEQFYLVLPFALLLVARLKHRITQVMFFGVLGVASAVLMVGLSTAGAEPTRIYFGSDSHTFGLLLGVALACLVHRETTPAPRFPVFRQWGLGSVAVLGFAVLAWLAITLREASPESFRGGFQLATLAALAIVWAITRPGALIGQGLDVAPMRWVGERSYGIYLWHWPILLIVAAAFGPWARTPSGIVAVGATTFVLTFVAAAVSYRYLEQPVRRIGLIRSIRLMFAPTTARRRAVSITVGALLIVTVPATAIAIANAPTVSSAASAINRGQAALDQQQPGIGGEDPGMTPPDAAAPGDTTPGTSSSDSSTSGTGSATGSTPGVKDCDTEPFGSAKDAAESSSTPGTDPEPQSAQPQDRCMPPALVPAGQDMSAIGDSVMLASVPELDAAFPGLWVDAAVSRGMGAGVGIVETLAAQQSLRPVVIVGLGTNGQVVPEELAALRQNAGTRWIILINGHAERDWIPGVNQTLADFAAAHRGVVLADWDAAITPHPEALAGDGIHPEPSGGEIYASAIRSALEALRSPSEVIGFGTPRR